MKKILAFVAAAFMLSGSLFAKEVLHNLDFSVPIDSQTFNFTDDDFDNQDVSGVGFNFDYSRMTVNENGFSFIFGANIGYASLDIDDFDDNLGGIDLGLKLGWGGTPVNTDKALLSIHGFLGFDFKYAAMTESIDFGYDSYDVDYDVALFDVRVGVDAVFAFRFNDKIGLNAGIDLYTNLGGGSFGYDADGGDSDNFGFTNFGGIGFVPKIGLTIFN